MTSKKGELTHALLLAGTLAVGVGTLWAVLSTWLGVTLMESWPGGRRPPVERVVVATDGTPLIEAVTTNDRNLAVVTYRDPNGRPREGVNRRELVTPVFLGGEPGGGTWPAVGAAWTVRIRPFWDETAPGVAWYFVHDGRGDDGSGEFVAYQRLTDREIGRLGLAGFRAGPVPPAERIPVRGAVALTFSQWSSVPLTVYSSGSWATNPGRWDVPPRLVHVPSGTHLRVADLAARTVTTVFEAPEPIASVGVPMQWSYSGTGDEPPARRPVLVRAGSTVYELDRDYKVVGTFAIPAAVGPQGSINWYDLGDGRAVAECYGVPYAGAVRSGDTQRVTVYQVAADGPVTGTSELVLRSGATWPGGKQAELTLAAATVPSPAALVPVMAFLAKIDHPQQGSWSAFGAFLSRAWPTLAAVVVLAAVLAAGAWVWGRAFGLSSRERAAWAVFVLLLGAPGLVGFLLHRRWPARVPCPACGARSACDHDACTHCESPFPAPALNGTEIFA